MTRSHWTRLSSAVMVLWVAGTACAQPAIPGSTAFCLHEIPMDDAGKRRWINLGVVQYVETTRSELKISYGGGGLGSGYEVKIPISSMDEALAILERMRKAAAACR